MKRKLIVTKPLIKACGLMLACLPLLSLAEQDTPLADSIRHSLLEQGWQEYQASDGSTIYRKPNQQQAASAPAPEPVQQATATDDIDQQREMLRQALADRGWLASWEEDGSVILRRAATQTEEPAPAVQAAPPAATQEAAVSEPPPAPAAQQTPVIPNMPGFEYWDIKRDTDGSLLFFPVKQGEEEPLPSENAPAATEAPEEARPVPAEEPAPEAAPAPESAAVEPATPIQCEGFMADLDGVTLPVDEWEEAKTLSQRWIDASGMGGLQVGKIRKILRVYLVSIVTDAEPFNLVHQISINTVDGNILQLN